MSAVMDDDVDTTCRRPTCDEELKARVRAAKRTAHFERWLFWARELYMEKKLLLKLVRDEDMMADALSKESD